MFKVNGVLDMVRGEIVSLENIAEMNDTTAIKKVLANYFWLYDTCYHQYNILSHCSGLQDI